METSVCSRIRSALAEFGLSDRGNIAVIFAIACVPLISFIGAAIDYSRANAARSSMQAALDSTALMVSKDLSQGLITTSQINARAQAYFAGLYTNKDAQLVAITATYTAASGSNGSTILVNGSGSITTDFMKVAGFPNMNFNTSSTATWGNNLLRVALVLDNTGSMNAYNKIGALQTAAKNLVTQLSGLAKNNGVASKLRLQAPPQIGRSRKILTTVNLQLQPLSYKFHLAFGYCATQTYAPRRAT